MKLILDTDPGIDDALAYFYAHAHQDIDLVAMTTVFGNVTTAKATRNALWLKQISNAETTVHHGAEQPLEIPLNDPADYVHGKNGFGDFEIGDLRGQKSAEDAVSFLIRMARENPGEFTLCAIGPLTNVALAVQRDPSFLSNLQKLVIMGGSLDAGGNVTEFAEANFWNDPHAANVVLNAPGSSNIVIVGLDVTDQIAFGQNDFDEVTKNAPHTGTFLNEIGQFYMRFNQSITGKFQCFLHDPAALVACLNEELFQMQTEYVEVITSGDKIGQLKRRPTGDGRSCEICMDVDVQAVLQEYKTQVYKNV